MNSEVCVAPIVECCLTSRLMIKRMETVDEVAAAIALHNKLYMPIAYSLLAPSWVFHYMDEYNYSCILVMSSVRCQCVLCALTATICHTPDGSAIIRRDIVQVGLSGVCAWHFMTALC